MTTNDPRNAHISETVTIPLRDFAVAMELVQRLTCHPAHPDALGNAARLLLKYRTLDAVRTAPLSLNAYQQEMQRTYKPDRKANHALGLAGEAAEVAELQQLACPVCEGYGAKSGCRVCNETGLRVDSRDAAELLAVGKLCDVVKKDAYHKRPVDRDAMKKELGDRLWYTAALATDYGLTLEDVAQANVDKLKARYPDGFVHGGGNRG